ncbi:MAG: hypothetical protein V4667_10875 [Bacteroidota bacterium]
MKKNLPIIILLAIVNFLLIIVNIQNIPAGNEMGGLAQAIIALFFSGIIFYATTTLSVWLSKKDNNYQVLQIFIFITSAILTYCASWYVCVYEKPYKADSVYRNEEIIKGNQNKNKVFNTFKNSENNYKRDRLSISDSLSLRIFFSDFLSENNINNDSNFHSTFYEIFNLNIEKNDTVILKEYIDRIKKSISIDYMGYSPNRNFNFVILTYELRKRNVYPLVLIGNRLNNNIKYHKYPCYRDDGPTVTKDYLLFKIIERFNEFGVPCNHSNPLEYDFWNSEYFDTLSINNKKLYRYQLEYSLSKKYSSNSILPSIKVKFIPAKK